MAALAWPELFESPNPPNNCDTPSIPCARDEPGSMMHSIRTRTVALTKSVYRVILIFLETCALRPIRKTKRRRAGYKKIQND
jgi:hypothetical protein